MSRRTEETAAAAARGGGSLLTAAHNQALQLERVVSLAEASELTGLSIDSLKRHYAGSILRLSPRRLGMRLRAVLEIGAVGSDAA